MKPRSLLLGLFGLLQLQMAVGQHAIFRSYSMSDGLSNNAIRKIFQDSQGFIWICTWEGLSKFEGNKFTTYVPSNGLPHSMVNDVIELSPGVMMVAMNNGMISYIRHGRLDPQVSRSSYIVNQFLQDQEKGLMGVSDSFGIVKINSPSRPVSTDTGGFSLYQIIPWHDYYITIGDPNPVRIYDRALRLISKPAVKDFIPNCIYKSRNDQILLGTTQGIFTADLSDPVHPVFLPDPPPFHHPLIKNSSVQAILEDYLGNIWIGTNSGLIRVAPSGMVSTFSQKDGLPSNRITSITADVEKNIWIGTYSGLAKLPFQSLTVMAAANGQRYQGSLQHISLLNSNQLALITSDAVYRYDMLQDEFHVLKTFDPGNMAVPIQGSAPFSFIYRDKIFTWELSSQQLVSQQAYEPQYYFSAAQYNRITCAASGGLHIRFGNGKIISALDSIRIHCVTWDNNGRILAGTWNSGLYRISIDTIHQEIREIEDFSSIPQLTLVRSLHIDKHNNIWAGTRYNGMMILAEKQKGKFNITRLSQKNGLISNWVHYIMEAPDGNIWLGSLAGISKVVITGDTYRVFNFGKAVDFYASMSGLVCTGKNQFWGSSDNGLFTFTDNQLENTAPLPVYFTGIKLGKSDSAHVFQESGRRVRLGYTDNYLRFEFASPGFINEKDIFYTYHLRGSNDTTWSEATKQHAVEYASLSPGQYVFEVKMKGWNGEYGPVNSFAFIINPPFWKTWWFYVTTILIFMIAVFAIYWYRTRQLFQLQKIRNAIATDLHDEIGSSLTNISILSQLSLNSLEQGTQTRNFIDRIRDEVQSSNQALDDIIWSVNTRHDNLEETLARMRRYVGELFDNSNIPYQIDIPGTVEDIKLHMEQRRDLFLIFKEALNNIHKHAGATCVWIKVTVSDKWIRMSVTDDGAGFDLPLPVHRNGLKNMQDRVNKWKGEFRVKSAAGQGTTIEIGLPVRSS